MVSSLGVQGAYQGRPCAEGVPRRRGGRRKVAGFPARAWGRGGIGGVRESNLLGQGRSWRGKAALACAVRKMLEVRGHWSCGRGSLALQHRAEEADETKRGSGDHHGDNQVLSAAAGGGQKLQRTYGAHEMGRRRRNSDLARAVNGVQGGGSLAGGAEEAAHGLTRLLEVVDRGRPRCLWASGASRRRLCGATLMSGRLVARSGACGSRQRRGVKIVVYGEVLGVSWPLLPFSWAADVLEVAEAIRCARLIAGVACDALRQVGSEGSNDLMLAQVRLGAKGARMQLLHGYMEGVNRAIEGQEGRLNSLQEGP
ncbi:hypothetical protein ACSSS7_004973 [Eimeria intestinalis]